VSPGTVFFGVCATAALAGALWTVIAKNPIRGALGLLVTIFGIAGLFLKLSAQFLAAIQLIVYAGAVVVLFVFVIMLLGSDASGADRGAPKARVSRGIAAVLLAMIAGFGIALLTRPGDVTRFGPAPFEHGSVEAVGGRIFGPGIVPFELATALLVVAVVGAIAVAKGRQTVGPRAPAPASPRDFFHGPLLARDDRGQPPAAEPPAPAPGHGGHG
jgi:NADH-quinone oxidoreductase subunit J